MEETNSNQTLATASQTASTAPQKKYRGGNFGGIFLILLGSLFLLEEIFPFWGFDRLWPLILIAVGIWLVYRHQDK